MIMRLGGILTAAAGVAGMLVAAAPAEAAAPATCIPRAVVSFENGKIRGDGYHFCTTGEPGYDDATTVQRQDPASGAWNKVAAGVGTVYYTCQGTASRTYRAITNFATSSTVTAACG